MSESASFSARVIPHGHLTAFFVSASLVGAGVAGLVAVVGVPPALSVPVVLLVLFVLVRRRTYDATWVAEVDGLRERLVPLAGGEPVERHWPWSAVRSYTLDREPTRSLTVRSVLLVRMPGYQLRVREPADAAGREAHARFVDRFVGYATGDVRSAPAEGGRGEEGAHRRPLTSGEAPQLRRTLAHQPAYRSGVQEPLPLLDRPMGRVVAALSALVMLALVGMAAVGGTGLGRWFEAVFVLVPAALWLAWRAVRPAPH